MAMLDKPPPKQWDEVVGELNSNQAYVLVMGGLLLRFLNRQQTDVGEIA